MRCLFSTRWLIVLVTFLLVLQPRLNPSKNNPSDQLDEVEDLTEFFHAKALATSETDHKHDDDEDDDDETLHLKTITLTRSRRSIKRKGAKCACFLLILPCFFGLCI